MTSPVLGIYSLILFFPSTYYHQTWFSGDFSGSPVVKTSPSNATSEGPIPGWGDKVLYASWQKKKKIKKQKQYSIKTLKNCPHQRKILKNKKHDLSKASPFIYPPNIIDIYWSCHTRIQKIIRHILVLSHSLLSLNPFWNFKKVVTLNLKIAVTNKLQISHYVQQEFINKQTQSLTGYCLYTNDLINQHS